MQALAIALVVLAAAVVASCGPQAPSSAPERDATTPRIELLGFPDCPNTPPMRAALLEALATMGPSWRHTDVNLSALDPGDPRRRYPAPTVLVNGLDLFGLAPSGADSLGCRVYPGGVPSAAAIAKRLGAMLPR